MLKTIEVLEAKIRPVTTDNLMTLLIAIDAQITQARQAADVSGNYDTVQAMNITRTAIINVMDERDPVMFDAYVDAKYARKLVIA